MGIRTKKRRRHGTGLLLAVLMIIMVLTGCKGAPEKEKNLPEQTAVDISAGGSVQSRLPSAPVKKAGGGKFRIAYIDIDEYPVTGSVLYHILEGMKQDGWIQYDSLPFEEDKVDAKALIGWLARRDVGPYVEFDASADYYLAYEGEEAVKKSLVDHVKNKKDIDLAIAMGTWPGKFAKGLDLGIPLMVAGSVDPIGAGIVKSAEETGDENIWAQVDPAAFRRQLQFYYDTIRFKNIGMVYNDEIVASIPDYEKIAELNGFKISKIRIAKLESDRAEAKEKYYADLKEIYRKLIQEDKIDAYLINTDVITDDTKMRELFVMFYEARIPIFVQVGDNYIKNGAFMQVSPRDYKGMGAFMANRLGAVFNGAKPGELSQEYISSPYLSLNLDVAEKIGFTPSFEMLLSCENIYTGEKQ